MNDTRKVTIRITGISSKEWDNGGRTIILEEGKNKYSFNETKRDGSVSKAKEGYDKLNLRVGDSIDAEISEMPKSFTNQKGETVNYTQRNILFFYTEPEQIPAQTPNRPAQQQETLEQRVLKLERAVFGTQQSVSGSMPATKTATEAAMPKPQSPSPVPDDEIPTINLDDELDDIRIEDVPF